MKNPLAQMFALVSQIALLAIIFGSQCAGCGIETSGLSDFGPGGQTGILGRGVVLPSASGGASLPTSTGGSASGGRAGDILATGGSDTLPTATGGSTVIPTSTGGSPVAPGTGGSATEPAVFAMDDGFCGGQADGASCEGRLSGANEPGSGVHLAGLCHASVCCMGCWDGTTCHYFNDTACPTGLSGGGECSVCSKVETCRIMVTSGRMLPHMACF